MSNLPASPSDRRIVFVVDGAADVSWRGPARADAMRGGGKHILNVDVARAAPDPLFQSLEEAGLAIPGAILALSPYIEDEYLPAHEATRSLAVQKAMYIAELCFLLGAKTFDFSNLYRSELALSHASDATLSTPTVGGRVEVKKEEEELLVAGLEIAERSQGGRADLEGAAALLHDRHLQRDNQLTSLVRRFHNMDNRLLEQRVEATLTSESTRLLQAAMNVRSAQLPASFDAAFETTQKSIAQFDVRYQVTF